MYNLSRKMQKYWIKSQYDNNLAAKTTLVDFKILRAIADAKRKNIPITVFYYSYEIDELTKKMNWLSTHIFTKYGVIIAPEKIGGLGSHELTTREQELVDAEVDYIEGLFQEIHFRFDPMHPTAIRSELMKHAEENGEFTFIEYTDAEGKKAKKIAGYKPHNEDEYVITVIDHLALLGNEQNFTLKERIDKMSQYSVWMRNICGYTFKYVQQFNQGLSNVDRAKFKGVDLSPQQSDFKDTTNPYTDADVVMGIMNPWKMDFKEYDMYDLTDFKERFRSLKVIKNRKGRDNVQIGLLFTPQGGTFVELPPASDFIGGVRQYSEFTV